jgi:predicted Rossmann fold flavoprotein
VRVAGATITAAARRAKPVSFPRVTDPTRRIAVIGAGAAGSLAAIAAAEAARAAGRGTEVLLLERTADGGRKILISGGGRCNVLPSAVDESRFVTDSSPNALRLMLRTWPHAEQVRFFSERLGLDLQREEESGKLFPRSNRARDVRDGLLREARAMGATLRFQALVQDVRPEAGRWRLALEGGDALDADAVIVATGGLSVPQTGSDGFGLRLAARLGHAVHPTYPALTPLTSQAPAHAALAGVSGPVTLHARAGGRRWRSDGGFLFTHRGYSGPAVLDLSHLAVRARLAGERQEILAQWTPRDAAAWDEALRAGGAAHAGTLVRRELPERLAAMLLDTAQVDPATPCAQLPRDARRRLVEALTALPLPWTGDEGYKKAEVTGGGVALGEVDPRTMESRRHPGLYLCGEVLDAFGPIGGYNFLWAWATGHAAGRAAAVSP